MTTTLSAPPRARVRPRTCNRQPLLVTHVDMLQMLNDDLCRERKAVTACAVYAEKLRTAGRPTLADAVAARGELEAQHAAKLAQLIRDFGGPVGGQVDELNAILNADRVARPEWGRETQRRLHDRARQLRTAGFPGFAKRLTRTLAEKRREADLCELLAGSVG